MHDLVQTMKKAALEAVETKVPTEVCVGLVEQEEPLQLRLSQSLVLSKSHLTFLKGQASPEEGDKLVLLRFAGGQKYLILGCLQ